MVETDTATAENRSSVMESLMKVKLFSHLPEPVLTALGQTAQFHQFQAGQTIFEQDDPADGLYVLVSGEVEIASALESGDRQVVAQAQAGEVFGELAVLDNLPRSARAIAATAVQCFLIPRHEILQLFKTCPDVAVELVKEISGRLRDFNRQYLREILQAERLVLVGRFARSIVHDLKNPLSTIRLAAAEGCGQATPPSRRQQALGWIEKELNRVTSLVDDILDFTHQPPAGIALERADFARSFQKIMAELQDELSSRSVTVEYRNPPPAVTLRFDPKRLAQVVRNLAHNAVDAMPNGGTITVGFQSSSDTIHIEVRDSGPGLAPEIKARLFEPFATFGKRKGTGLGLAICKQIVEEHGGRISATNHPSGGAVFTFSLPRPEQG